MVTGNIDGYRATRNGTITTIRMRNYMGKSCKIIIAGCNIRRSNSTTTKAGYNPNWVYSTTAG